MLKENLYRVQENIKLACEKAKRNPDEVTLIAVSKTKPVEMLQTIYNLNIRNFGENKVQEMCSKMDVLPDDIKWHMIGHLQTNKVKYIVGKTELIHSVDSIKLAKEIQKQAEKIDTDASILIEVNIANEDSKFGVQKEETIALIKEISKLNRVHIQGLMTIAPFVTNAEDNRQYFKEIKQLSVDIEQQNIDNVNMNVLSMGMTGDYMVAIEEGATHVRVGTGIFGERDYSI